jgi:hypothetical protein
VRERRRSFCFLERDGERWTAFLCTYPVAEGGWRGHFTFRRGSEADPGVADEIRTAVLFVEGTEGEVDARARGLGRPLVRALLDSALHSYERRKGFSPDLRRWFRELLVRHAAALPVAGTPAEERSLAHLQSLYDSYRLEQVMHLIALIQPQDFRELVERVLDGREIDFRARDRFQLAMSVVQELDRLLPLPPFELWAEDYLRDPDVYRVYSHALHGEGELP